MPGLATGTSLLPDLFAEQHLADIPQLAAGQYWEGRVLNQYGSLADHQATGVISIASTLTAPVSGSHIASGRLNVPKTRNRSAVLVGARKDVIVDQLPAFRT
jgi:hypothetical protein